MDTPKIEFYKLRDFGAKINALVEFLRENFGKLFLSLALIGGPAALLLSLLFGNLFSSFFDLGMQSESGDFDDFGDVFALLGGSYFMMLLMSWITVTLIVSVTYNYMKLYNEGVVKETSIGEIFGKSLSNMGGLLILGFLVMVVTVFGTFFFIIPGIFLGVTLSLAYPILVFENASVGTAFSRSFTLIREKWWSTFGLLFVSYMIAYVVQIVFSVPLLVVYFMNMFTLVEEVQNNPDDPSAFFEMFSSGYMTVAMAVSMVGSYLTYCIPLIALGYQYSNLVERSEGKGLMNEIENFDKEE
ncbi:MAG: hypothetical protein RIM99_10640 [Cyclobacteriaceae bacterium]